MFVVPKVVFVFVFILSGSLDSCHASSTMKKASPSLKHTWKRRPSCPK